MINTFKIKISVLLCSMALVLSLTEAAEKTIVVTAYQDAGANVSTAEYTVKTSANATKTDKSLITTRQSISSITCQEIDDQGAMVNQALNYASAFHQFYLCGNAFATILLRGFHSGNVDNIFLYGLWVMSDNGSHNNLQVNPWFLERIDVIKGPLSVPYE